VTVSASALHWTQYSVDLQPDSERRHDCLLVTNVIVRVIEIWRIDTIQS
jgi:hypothetical protein